MKSSTRDTVEGTGHTVKGAIKEVVGKVTKNPGMQAEGSIEKTAGKVQVKSGEIKNELNKKHEPHVVE